MAFVLEQPESRGVPVHFTDATAAAFSQPSNYHGPMAVLDCNHDGRNGLFVTEGEKGFRVLDNENGRFEPLGELLPGKPGANYRRCLVGDMNNDRFEDVIVLGEQASHAFKFATNGQARDFTAFTGLENLKARDGLLADLDFTGKLDLLAVRPDGSGLVVYQNLGNFYLQDHTAEFGSARDVCGRGARGRGRLEQRGRAGRVCHPRPANRRFSFPNNAPALLWKPIRRRTGRWAASSPWAI